MVFYCPFAISYLVKKKPRSRKYIEILSINNSYYWLEFQVCYQEFFSATSLNGNEGLRPRPHVSRNLWKRKFFFTNMACVHTYPAYFPSVSGNFWKRSPEWKFFIWYEFVYVKTVVSANLRIRVRHFLESSLHVEHYKQTWRTARLYLLC